MIAERVTSASDGDADCDVIKVPEAAKMLGMCPRSAGEKARKGLIPSVKIGGSRLFSKRVLREWLERGMLNGNDGK